MGVLARPLPIRPVPWRLFAIAAAILLLATAALVYVGSAQRVPPPFGPARNGAIVSGTLQGDIAAWDAVLQTKASGPRRWLGGREVPGHDPQDRTIPSSRVPGYRHVGGRLHAARTVRRADVLPDQTAAHESLDLSGSGDRALSRVRSMAACPGRMLDVASGGSTALPVDPNLGITLGMFRPGHDEVITSELLLTRWPDDRVPRRRRWGRHHSADRDLAGCRERGVGIAEVTRLAKPPGEGLLSNRDGSTSSTSIRGIDTALLFEGSADSRESRRDSRRMGKVPGPHALSTTKRSRSLSYRPTASRAEVPMGKAA